MYVIVKRMTYEFYESMSLTVIRNIFRFQYCPSVQVRRTTFIEYFIFIVLILLLSIKDCNFLLFVAINRIRYKYSH